MLSHCAVCGQPSDQHPYRHPFQAMTPISPVTGMSSVRKLRKKPVVVEGLRFLAGITTKSEILAFCPIANVGAPEEDEGDIRWIVIPTLEGNMDVGPGWWILKGIKGEFYPCRHDILLGSYDFEED